MEVADEDGTAAAEVAQVAMRSGGGAEEGRGGPEGCEDCITGMDETGGAEMVVPKRLEGPEEADSRSAQSASESRQRELGKVVEVEGGVRSNRGNVCEAGAGTATRADIRRAT